MRLIIFCALTAFLRSSWLIANDVLPRQDLGVVCLDELTGKPLWEYFPESPGLYQIRLDDENLYVVGRSWRTPKAEPIIEAVNLVNGRKLDNPTLPSDELLLPESRYYRGEPTSSVTSSGDRIAASRRAILVLDGTTDAIRWKLSLPDNFGQHFVHEDLIVYAQPERGDLPGYFLNEPETSPLHEIIAVDSLTQHEMWRVSFKGAPGRWTYHQGQRQLYLFDSEQIRAIDLDTGRFNWVQKLPRPSACVYAFEENNRLFVMPCDPVYWGTHYLYALDLTTGEVEWSYDPGGSNLRIGPQFHNGKIYARICPTRLMGSWRASGYRDGEGGWAKTPKQARVELIERRFAGKPSAEIALHLKSWHVLGDGFALPLLRQAAGTFQNKGLLDLAHELIETFPSVRDPLALITFLNEEFDRSFELRPEINLIALRINPAPYWYGKDTIGFPPRPTPNFELLPREQALIDAYGELQSKVGETPFGRIDQNILRELMQGRGTIGLERLLEAIDKESDPKQRPLITMAMFKTHPMEASDWALHNSERLTEFEEHWWVQMAPPDWIEAHPKLYTRWLRAEDTFIQGRAGLRLQELSKSFAVATSVELLREYVSSDENVPIYGVGAAMHYLARESTQEHVSLIKEYLVSNVTTMQRSMGNGVEFHTPIYTLRQTAQAALKKMGGEVEDVIETKGERQIVGDDEAIKKWRDEKSSRNHIEQLHSDMLNADYQEKVSKAKRLARQLLAVFKEKTASEYVLRGNYERDAYEVLEEWDKFIDSCRGEDSFCDDRWMMEAFIRAGRIEELDALLEDTHAPYLRIHGGFLLLDSTHLDRAFEIFADVLEEDSGSYESCVGLAEVHRKRNEFTEADSYMERAIALFPQPSDSPAFHHMVTYWLLREKPEKARAWVRKSAVKDYATWEKQGLFAQAARHSELLGAINQIRQRNGDPPLTRRGWISPAVIIALVLGILGFKYGRKRWRCSATDRSRPPLHE